MLHLIEWCVKKCYQVKITLDPNARLGFMMHTSKQKSNAFNRLKALCFDNPL
ncbi:hypothetical protein MHA_1152 [Mannheimia haemolytica PHL213]|nr:hypothetical protein MHA_1152 [Mannheimia haemolytica PHL213]